MCPKESLDLSSLFILINFEKPLSHIDVLGGITIIVCHSHIRHGKLSNQLGSFTHKFHAPCICFSEYDL